MVFIVTRVTFAVTAPAGLYRPAGHLDCLPRVLWFAADGDSSVLALRAMSGGAAQGSTVIINSCAQSKMI